MNHQRAYLVFVVLLAVASTAVTWLWGSFELVDSAEYIAQAERMFGSHAPVDDLSELTKRPPAYPFLIAVFGKVGVVLIQNVALVVTLIWLFRRLNPSTKKARVWLYVSTLLSVNIFLYADRIMAETWVMMGLWLLYVFYADRKWILFLITLALLPFFKPVFLFLPLGLLPVFLWRSETRKWSLGLAICFGVSLSFMAFNQHRTGSFEFSSIQHINALHYNKYQFDVHRYGADYAAQVNDSIKQLGSRMSYPKRVELYNSAFISDVKQAPLEYLGFHVFGAIRGVIDPGRFDLQFLLPTTVEEGFAHRQGNSLWDYLRSLSPITWLVLLPIALFNMLRALLALIGFWRERFNLVSWVALLLVGYLVFITGPINASRFVVPAVPLLILLSAKGLKMRLGRK